MPLAALQSAIGIMLVAVANALSRSGSAGGDACFWAGILVVFVPAVAWQVRVRRARTERIVRLLLLGATFYVMKVLRDPFGFTYADELVHQYNAQRIVSTGRLFGHNPILPVTPSYPGLESVTAAVASTAGVSTFIAGLVVVGIARLIFMLALFLFYERVSGSALVAGLAGTFYAISPHFLFFTAQFSYESLALPLFAVVLLSVVRAWPDDGRTDARWAIVGTLAMVGVIVTHHMTSYALIALLVVVCLVPLPWRSTRARRPWTFTAATIAVAATWLVLVASQTVGYLSPVLTKALTATFRTAAGESPSRQLFQSAGGHAPPSWEHFAALGSALLIVTAIPIGLHGEWRRQRDHPMAVMLGIMAAAYVATLPLRFVPAAWETAVRASEFLFIGVALVAAHAVIRLSRALPRSPLVSLVAIVAAAVAILGGVVSASSKSGRLGMPFKVSVGDRVLDPPALAVALWAETALGHGQRVAAEEADARLLLTYAGEHVFAGTNPPIKSVLQTPTLYRWQLDVLRKNRIRYVVVDARTASADVTSGYFFSQVAPAEESRFSRSVVTKFERAGARRLYDNGDIVVDDLSEIRYADAHP